MHVHAVFFCRSQPIGSWLPCCWPNGTDDDLLLQNWTHGHDRTETWPVAEVTFWQGSLQGNPFKITMHVHQKMDPSNINPHVLTPLFETMLHFAPSYFHEDPNFRSFYMCLVPNLKSSWQVDSSNDASCSFLGGKQWQPEKKMQRECQKNMSKNCWTNIPCQSMLCLDGNFQKH